MPGNADKFTQSAHARLRAGHDGSYYLRQYSNFVLDTGLLSIYFHEHPPSPEGRSAGVAEWEGGAAPRAQASQACSREMCGEGLLAHYGAPDGVFRRAAG